MRELDRQKPTYDSLTQKNQNRYNFFQIFQKLFQTKDFNENPRYAKKKGPFLSKWSLVRETGLEPVR